MTTLHFPDPNITTEYNAPNGVTYNWDGVKWVPQAAPIETFSIENWEPVETNAPLLVNNALSDNTQFASVPGGVNMLPITPGSGNPQSAATSSDFTLSDTEVGIYCRIGDVGDTSGYIIFSDDIANWWQVGGYGIGVYYDYAGAGPSSLNLVIQANTFNYNFPTSIPDIRNRDVCLSIRLVGNDVTINLYVNDGVDTPSSPPVATFTQTIQASEAAEMVANLSRGLLSNYSLNATVLHYETPPLEYNNVTQLAVSGVVDPASYPTPNVNSLYRVSALTSPLYAADIDVTIDNGFLVSFNSANQLETASPELTANELSTMFPSFTAPNTFSGVNTFEGEFIDYTHLESNGTDSFNLDFHKKYLFKIRSNSTAATVELPSGDPSPNSLLPYIHITAIGKGGSVDVVDNANGDSLWINGQDTFSNSYTLSSGSSVVLVRGPTSDDYTHWHVVPLTSGEITRLGNTVTYLDVDTVTRRIDIQPNSNQTGNTRGYVRIENNDAGLSACTMKDGMDLEFETIGGQSLGYIRPHETSSGFLSIGGGTSTGLWMDPAQGGDIRIGYAGAGTTGSGGARLDCAADLPIEIRHNAGLRYQTSNQGYRHTNAFSSTVEAIDGTINISSSILNISSTSDCTISGADVILTTPATNEVSLGLQTSAMNGGSPTDLAVATKKYVDDNSASEIHSIKAVTVQFSHTDSVINVGTTIPPQSLVVRSRINMTTAFDDPAATATVGNATTPAGISTTTDSDLSTVGLYVNDTLFDVAFDGQIQLTVNSGTSTMGQGRVLVEYYIPLIEV